jgi:hypothetical protein
LQNSQGLQAAIYGNIVDYLGMRVAFRSAEADEPEPHSTGGPTMLRTIKKLVLRRNTIRTLTHADLAIVDGAGVDNTSCTTQTREASTCVQATAVPPAPGRK